MPWHVPLQAVERAIRATGEGSPSEQAIDVFESFEEWFPDEAAVLRALWSRDPEEREYAAELLTEDSKAVAHARPYGLSDDDLHPRIRAILTALGSQA